MGNLRDRTLALAAALDPSRLAKDLLSFDRALIERAVSEGVAGVLYRSLLASGRLESLAQVHKEVLQSHYYKTIRTNLQLLHALKQVLRLAGREGVPVVLLQGMALLIRGYDDIGLRPVTDIDLWVAKKDYGAVVRILESLGYKRDAVYPGNFKQGLVFFDVHTHLLWADRVRAFRMLLVDDEERVRRNLMHVEVEGEKALCLDPYDQVLYLTLHAIKHWTNRLIWLVDIKTLVERWGREEWDSFRRRSKELGQEKTLEYMVFLLRSTLRVRVPPWPVRSTRRRLNALERWVLMQRSQSGALPRWAPVLLFSSEMGAGQRATFFLENLFPKTEVLRQVFPTPPDLKPWQLYGRRAAQLVRMLGRALKGSEHGAGRGAQKG
jgi:hypothetical protein